MQLTQNNDPSDARDLGDTDASLVQAYQAGDVSSFDTLYSRFRVSLEKTAIRYHSKNRYLTVDEWTSYIHEWFIEATRKYRIGAENEGGMDFRTYLRWKIAKRATDAIRTHRYTYQSAEAKASGRMIRKDDITPKSLDYAYAKEGDEAEELYSVVEDVTARISVQQEDVETPLYAYLRQHASDVLPFLELYKSGYTYEEIAALQGREGTSAANKNWGKRIMAKLQDLALRFYSESGAIDELRAFVPSV